MKTMTRAESAINTVTTVPQSADISDPSTDLVQTGSIERMTDSMDTNSNSTIAKMVAFADRFTAGTKNSSLSLRDSMGSALARTVLVGSLFAMFAFAQGQMMLLMNPDNPVMGSSSPSVSVVDQREVVEQARITELSEKFDCSPEGFGEGVYPARALVRFSDKYEGRTKVVSFDRAWDVVEGREPGTVVAFCLR